MPQQQPGIGPNVTAASTPPSATAPGKEVTVGCNGAEARESYGQRLATGIAGTLVINALLVICALYAYTVRVRATLRQQARNFAAERSQWGHMFSEHVEQSFYDLLFTNAKYDPGALDEVKKKIALTFGPDGTVLREIETGYFTAEQGEALRAKVADMLTRRLRINEEMLAGRGSRGQ